MKSTEYFYEYPKFNNVKEIMYDVVKKYPNNIAFILKNKLDDKIEYKNITYKDFLEDVNLLGSGLCKLGLKNKKIAIIGKNSYKWALSYVAILLGNMVAVPLDKGLTDIEIENTLIQSQVDCVIFENKYFEVINKIKSEGKSRNKRTYLYG